MKKIWKFLVHHVQEDFNLRVYLLTFLFLAASVYVNYRYDFEDTFLDTQKGFLKFFYYFLFYGFAYYSTMAIVFFSKKGSTFFRERDFWIRSVLVLAALSLDGSQPYLHSLVNALAPAQLNYWVYKVANNLIGFVNILLPLLLFHRFYDHNQKHYYGLQVRHFDTRPYFMLLLIMLPLIVAASFEPSFVKQYPMYKVTSAHTYLGVPEWVTVACYELAYGLDFITVEFLFRGFMVIGMMHVVGRNAVLAMAVTYCYLHFGKPAGEAVSSIYGGYILGVVAYETKGVWGGVIVHVGIAWLMELVAYLQKLR